MTAERVGSPTTSSDHIVCCSCFFFLRLWNFPSNRVHRNHSAMRAGVPGVVVMSIGSRQSECEAAHVLTESLSGQNIIVIAAAGNSGTDACLFHPASAKTAITVGAMEIRNAGDTAWSKTNFGSCVDVYAPGTPNRMRVATG